MNGSWAEFPAKTWTEGDIKGGGVWQFTWWPATGLRNYSSAAMGNVAYTAYYWSSSPYPSYAYQSYYLNFNYNGYVNPSNISYRSNGFPLRCVQE